MKIDIIYRCCGKEVYPDQLRASRPAWFSKSLCYKSSWDMTNNDPYTFRMHVIYEGEPSSFLDYIEGMRVADSAIYKVSYPNDKYGSIKFQWDYADQLNGDWIYFCEDDYLHTPDAGRVMVEGINLGLELISLYDHLDRYTRNDDRTVGMESVALSSSCHWRTAESTCSTYALSRNLWNQIRDICRKHGPNDRSFFYELIEKGIRLWTPIPGRATHCMKGYMSPLVDWDSIAAGVRL